MFVFLHNILQKNPNKLLSNSTIKNKNKQERVNDCNQGLRRQDQRQWLEGLCSSP